MRSSDGLTCMCILAAATTVVQVAGKPHCVLDDYAKSILAQYYPALANAAELSVEPFGPANNQPAPAFDYGQPASRSGRSNEPDPEHGEPALVATPTVPQQHVATPIGRYFGYLQPSQHKHQHSVETATAPTKTEMNVPCKTGVAGNDTSSVATVEKLKAYYEQLKLQQEALARQQLQQQLYEQQQRRQQEFALFQQQIQQQYFQQQQHALFMLDQLRKNPAFANQLAAFVNGTLAPGASAPAPDVGTPPSVPEPPKVPEPNPEPAPEAVEADDKDQNPVDHEKMEDSTCNLKHVEARQAPGDQDSFEDEQSPPVLEKVYSVASE